MRRERPASAYPGRLASRGDAKNGGETGAVMDRAHPLGLIRHRIPALSDHNSTPRASPGKSL